VFDLAQQYGPAYLADFEDHLRLLRRAFDGKPWPDWAVRGYVSLTKKILVEEIGFRESGAYSAQPDDLARIIDEVYDNEDVMDRYYLVGLYCTYFLWPHHYKILEFYRTTFLQTGAPPEQISEWGVGHGLLSLEALRTWPHARAALVDISRFSLDFSQRLLEAAGVGVRCQYQRDNVMDMTALPVVDRIICSELLEHVPDPNRLLKQVYDGLRPGGCAYLTGAINAAQPDHIFLFTTSDELFQMVESHGFRINAHLTTSHPNREHELHPPSVLALVVDRPA
jgi:2-polyprenyl-3-methyl-5-hydroxy-6-metoxy-1,4-benzoquinol methylase